MASHDPSVYRFSTPSYIALYTLLLTAYYVCVLYFYPKCTCVLIQIAVKLRYLDVPEVALQNANAGNHQVPECLPSIPVQHC